ncbi:MAG TPA: hypothetical protein VLZ78_04005 [Terrimesophilobacter sp.]|nr:hypothetical protein [Terrimesophilobacter sp.]
MRDYKPNGTVRVSREFDREVSAHRRGDGAIFYQRPNRAWAQAVDLDTINSFRPSKSHTLRYEGKAGVVLLTVPWGHHSGRIPPPVLDFTGDQVVFGYTGTQEQSPLERAAERLIELIEARNPVAPAAIDEVIELLQEAAR